MDPGLRRDDGDFIYAIDLPALGKGHKTTPIQMHSALHPQAEERGISSFISIENVLKRRMPPKSTCSFTLEKNHAGPVCGLDEAGRGPLAGPVMAACVYIPEDARRKHFWKDVNDSKTLPLKERERLYDLIIAHAHYGIAEATVDEIDRINILLASMLAMKRAMEAMMTRYSITPAVALVDGNYPPALPCSVRTVVEGDSISRSIAAASILAKVTRDRLMRELCRQFPVYGWSTNAGYGTPAHLAALEAHGTTIHHRKSFAPVQMNLFKSA